MFLLTVFLQLLSNGIFKSLWHRVVINSEAERISVAMFFYPDNADEIGPLDQLVDEERPKMFNKVTNYKGGYFNYYHQEKRGIDALRIQWFFILSIHMQYAYNNHMIQKNIFI